MVSLPPSLLVHTQPVALPISPSLSVSFYGSGICVIAHSLRTNACRTPLSLAALPVNMCISFRARPEPPNPWREAAFCICMALSGVTCYPPPPPSATIEAIEALEPHDEDREGKPALHPSQHTGQGFLLQVPQSTHTEINPSSRTGWK